MNFQLGDEMKLEALKPSLTAAIEQWMESVCGTEKWDCVGSTGDGLAKLMSDAAWSVLLGSVDLQKYLARENMLSD